MSGADLILAHDLGTSGNKATLYTSEGVRLGSATESYPSRFFNGCWAEQDPDDWWRAVCASTRRLLAETKADPADVAVVALSGQMMGCTPVDAQGNALRPSILYCDQRATAEADALLARMPLERFYRIVGHRVSASYTLEKLMWLRANEPEVFAKTAKTLCAKDYVNFRLTGRMATDRSDASGTNAFDINTFKWSEEVLACAEIPQGLFPEALPSTAILGGVTAEAGIPDAAATLPLAPVASAATPNATPVTSTSRRRGRSAFNAFSVFFSAFADGETPVMDNTRFVAASTLSAPSVSVKSASAAAVPKDSSSERSSPTPGCSAYASAVATSRSARVRKLPDNTAFPSAFVSERQYFAARAERSAFGGTCTC